MKALREALAAVFYEDRRGLLRRVVSTLEPLWTDRAGDEGLDKAYGALERWERLEGVSYEHANQQDRSDHQMLADLVISVLRANGVDLCSSFAISERQRARAEAFCAEQDAIMAAEQRATMESCRQRSRQKLTLLRGAIERLTGTPKAEKLKRRADRLEAKLDEALPIEDLGSPYYGAIGGSMTWSFTPTGIGVVVKVKHASGAELDLTDYDEW